MLMITLVFLLNIFLVVRLLMNQCHSFRVHMYHHYICYVIITSLSNIIAMFSFLQLVNRNERKEEFSRDDLPFVFPNDLVNE